MPPCCVYLVEMGPAARVLVLVMVATPTLGRGLTRPLSAEPLATEQLLTLAAVPLGAMVVLALGAVLILLLVLEVILVQILLVLLVLVPALVLMLLGTLALVLARVTAHGLRLRMRAVHSHPPGHPLLVRFSAKSAAETQHVEL